MALFIRSEELTGLISITEAVDAVEKGFASQEDHPVFSLPRQRMLANDRRITVHSGGCVPLGVAGTFVHYERHNYTAQDQSYAAVGTRVYVCYDSETGALLAIIAGCPPFYRRQAAGDEFATETAITSAVGTRRMAGRTPRCWDSTAPAARRAAMSKPCAPSGPSGKCGSTAAAPATAAPSATPCSPTWTRS